MRLSVLRRPAFCYRRRVERIRADLALAEKHVADDARILAMKRQAIDQRQRDGRNTGYSEKRLQALEQRYARHIAKRDRLRQKLERTRQSSAYARKENGRTWRP